MFGRIERRPYVMIDDPFAAVKTVVVRRKSREPRGMTVTFEPVSINHPSTKNELLIELITKGIDELFEKGGILPHTSNIGLHWHFPA